VELRAQSSLFIRYVFQSREGQVLVLHYALQAREGQSSTLHDAFYPERVKQQPCIIYVTAKKGGTGVRTKKEPLPSRLLSSKIKLLTFVCLFVDIDNPEATVM